jgi:hypothetical protein
VILQLVHTGTITTSSRPGSVVTGNLDIVTLPSSRRRVAIHEQRRGDPPAAVYLYHWLVATSAMGA